MRVVQKKQLPLAKDILEGVPTLSLHLARMLEEVEQSIAIREKIEKRPTPVTPRITRLFAHD